MMTKKEFKLIASSINNSIITSEAGYKHISIDILLDNLSDSLYKNNPNFNAAKFKEACIKDKI